MPFARVNSQFEPVRLRPQRRAVADADRRHAVDRQDPAERHDDRLVADGGRDGRPVDGDRLEAHRAEPRRDRVELDPVDRPAGGVADRRRRVDPDRAGSPRDLQVGVVGRRRARGWSDRPIPGRCRCRRGSAHPRPATRSRRHGPPPDAAAALEPSGADRRTRRPRRIATATSDGAARGDRRAGSMPSADDRHVRPSPGPPAPRRLRRVTTHHRPGAATPPDRRPATRCRTRSEARLPDARAC